MYANVAANTPTAHAATMTIPPAEAQGATIPDPATSKSVMAMPARKATVAEPATDTIVAAATPKRSSAANASKMAEGAVAAAGAIRKNDAVGRPPAMDGGPKPTRGASGQPNQIRAMGAPHKTARLRADSVRASTNPR